MQTSSVDELVGQVLDDYRIERFLGKGRLNAVYLVRNVATQRIDALVLYLVPSPFSQTAYRRFLVRFQKEAAAIAALAHPHILPVYAYGEMTGHPYLITPYLTDGSIADLLQQEGHFDHRFVGDILTQAAAGLSYAHRKGFIHGTLRPSNIVFCDNDKIAVSSFGLMDMLQLNGLEEKPQPYSQLLSIAGTFLVAPEYVAPEIVQGKQFDQRADIYSLGCILFELLSGRPPFEGNDPLEISQQHVNGKHPPLRSLNPDVPKVLELVVHQSMARNPDQRFQSIEELEEAFLQASDGASVQTANRSRMTGEETVVKQQAGGEMGRSGLVPGGGWQLMPPIVTSRVPAVKAPPAANTAPATNNRKNRSQDMYEQEDVVRNQRSGSIRSTRRLDPAMSDMTFVPEMSADPFIEDKRPEPTRQSSREMEKQSSRAMEKQRLDVSLPGRPKKPTPIANSFVGSAEEVEEIARNYAWWSDPDNMVDRPASPQRAPKPQGPEPMQKNAQQPMVLNGMNDFGMDGFNNMNMPARQTRSNAQRGNKVQRRRVVAWLTAGGVAVAAGAIGIKMLPALGAPGGTTPGTTASVQQNNNVTTTSQTGNTTQKTTATTPKNVIATTQTLAVNTSKDYTNPDDGKQSVVIRLTATDFVAYEKACTHEGVIVNYDPAKKLLVCPAHGAIFDPAKGAAVLQGPALTPLAAAKIQVNADGSVSAV